MADLAPVHPGAAYLLDGEAGGHSCHTMPEKVVMLWETSQHIMLVVQCHALSRGSRCGAGCLYQGSGTSQH